MSLKPPIEPTVEVPEFENSIGPPVLGVDVWDSVESPESITDWGTVINGLLDAGAKRLLFRDEDFPFTTTLNLSRTSVVLEGMTGLNWADHGIGTGVSHLLWKGTGSGRAVDLRSADGVCIRDLVIDYDSGSYTGDLIDLGKNGLNPSAFVTFERVRLGPEGLKTARCILRLDGSVMPIFKGFSIRGAQSAIRGLESGGNGFAANDGVFEDGVFTACDVFFMNIGTYWRMKNLTFEYTNPFDITGITSDFTYTGDQRSIFWMTDCNHWDPAGAPHVQIPIDQLSTNPMTAIIRGGVVENGFADGKFSFLGPGVVIVEDTKFFGNVNPGAVPHIDVGTNAGGAQKTLIRIKGIQGSSNDDTGFPAIDNLDGGHIEIDVSGSERGGVLGVRTLRGVERLGYDGADPGDKLSTAMVGGQPAATRACVGNAISGYLVVQPTGGDTTAGDLVTVTLPTTARVPGVDGLPGGTSRVLNVNLTPAAGSLVLTVSGSATWDAGFYVKPTSTTSFTVGTKNVVPNNTVIGWFYRIVSM